MSIRTILIIGGAGYIGSYVNKILQKTCSTIVLDNLSRGYSENVPDGQLIVEDFGNQAVLQEIFSKNRIDAVMHFAAFTDVGESVRDPKKYFHNNVVKTFTLLDTMLDFGVKHLVFSSSAAVYGNPIEEKITESHPTHPINPYGETKLFIEKVLADYRRAYGLQSCSLRYFNAAGADPEGVLKLHLDRVNNLIPVLIRCLQEGKPVRIFGDDYSTPDGTAVRDYIHIHDLASAHVLALEYVLSGGNISAFNLGNGEGFSVKQVIEAMGKVLGRPVPFTIASRRAGDPPSLVADAALAKKVLNWKPIYPGLETIIRDALRASVC